MIDPSDTPQRPAPTGGVAPAPNVAPAPIREVPWVWFRNPAFSMPRSHGRLALFASLNDAPGVLGHSSGLLLAASALTAVIWVVSSLVFAWVPLGSYVVGALVHTPLFAGLMFLGVRCARPRLPGEFPASIDDLFAGFRRYPVLVIVGGIKAIALALVSLANIPTVLAISAGIHGGQGGAADLLLAVVGFVATAALWIAALVVLVRLLLAEVVAIDPRLGGQAPPGAMDALRVSWGATGPVFWPLLGMSAIVALLGAASAMALCIGLVIFGLPYGAACFGLAYARSVGPLDPGICAHCGYSLAGLPQEVPCPECGGSRHQGVRHAAIAPDSTQAPNAFL